MKKALIAGITGQDGAHLAKLLLEKDYEVWGTSRDAGSARIGNLRTLGIEARVALISMAPNDFRSVYQAVDRSEPDEIYYLSGQSSVGLSFEQPAETLESIVSGVLNILEVIRFRGGAIRLYNAGSSECFGNTGSQPADEATPFMPRSPYAVAKSSAHWLVANYREAYGLFCCTGILFNHESTTRPERFVTQKIVTAAAQIAAGNRKKLILGNLDIARDWGWAPEYVEAMALMLSTKTPADYIIATGQTNSLRDFVSEAFSFFNLDWQEYVETSDAFRRPNEIQISRADPSRAFSELGWAARTFMRRAVHEMCEAAKNSSKMPP